MDSKVIKGQALIVGDSLVQDQITISSDGTVTEGVVTLIPNIWEDLVSESGKFKSNAKKTFFYWEYKQTDSEDDTSEVDVLIECPKPKEGLFSPPYTAVGRSDWEKYWLGRLKKTAERYEDAYAIQKKQVIFPETTFIDQKGQTITFNEFTEKNNDIDDISNLLSMF